MQSLFPKQRGFAMAAMFIVAGVAFAGSLMVKTEDGMTVASKMGIGADKTTDFASMEAADAEQGKESNTSK